MYLTLAIYIGLFIVKSLYAFALSKYPRLQPDFTWFLVVVGVGICMAAAALDRRLTGPLRVEEYELRVWLALIVGGIPIAVWQIGTSVRAWTEVFRRLFRGITQ